MAKEVERKSLAKGDAWRKPPLALGVTVLLTSNVIQVQTMATRQSS